MFMHELVMLVFVGPKPPGKEVLHVKGDKKNCRLSNLRYGTRMENAADQVLMGERKDYIKVDQVLTIREFFDNGGTRPQAVVKYGISYQQANRIYHRVAYKAFVGTTPGG